MRGDTHGKRAESAGREEEEEKEEKLLYFEIGRRLKEFRENGKYTQEQFAEVLEVNVEHYRRLENGKYALSLKKLETLSKTYNLNLDYLITGTKDSREFNVEAYLANCDRDQRNDFIERVLLYMKNLMLNS